MFINLATQASMLLRLLLAALLGGVVGWERERMGKAAGVRTHMLVCIGSALIVELAMVALSREGAAGGELVRSDPSRVIQAVVTGIGFLAGGTIIVSRGAERVQGLTTAGSLWLTSAIGMAVGFQTYLLAVGSTALAFVVLHVVVWLTRGHNGDHHNGTTPVGTH